MELQFHEQITSDYVLVKVSLPYVGVWSECSVIGRTYGQRTPSSKRQTQVNIFNRGLCNVLLLDILNAQTVFCMA